MLQSNKSSLQLLILNASPWCRSYYNWIGYAAYSYCTSCYCSNLGFFFHCLKFELVCGFLCFHYIVVSLSPCFHLVTAAILQFGGLGHIVWVQSTSPFCLHFFCFVWTVFLIHFYQYFILLLVISSYWIAFHLICSPTVLNCSY